MSNKTIDNVFEWLQLIKLVGYALLVVFAVGYLIFIAVSYLIYLAK